ncbi:MULTISPECIES: IclR family transcriptional regulator [Nocardioides]|uniref:IclR family transcriptional regulator n=1 Tax=Nocardioides vastitatis TaxID=2568655 RepID=A0ABW0ZL36_9ACTN|nr:helix-turn-helix domain-containing protein [Nocardioides sp.]
MIEPADGVDGGSNAARGTLGTVRNAVLLLDLLSDGPAYQQLTELAERSGLSVPTAHRLLRSLVLAEIVQQDARTSRYSLGPEVVRLAQRYLARLPVLAALSPYLVGLRDILDSSIHVALLARDSVVYVDRVDAREGGPYRESHRVASALETPAGRLLVARAGDESWRRCVAAHNGRLPKDADELRAELLETEWLVAPDGLTGVALEAAVVVVDSRGGALAALSATLPAADPDRSGEVVQHLQRAAGAAGRTLGHG